MSGTRDHDEERRRSRFLALPHKEQARLIAEGLMFESVEAVLSIAESLPCGECGGTGHKPPTSLEEEVAASDGRNICEACHGSGHPDPATVAAGLPGLVKALEKIEQASDFIADEAPWDWQTDRLVEIRALASEARSALTSPCPGLGGIAKPQGSS